MDKCLLVNVNLFTMEHNIFVLANNNVKTYGAADLTNLPGILVGLAKDMDINNIKIVCNDSYASNLINEIKTKEKELYSNNELIVEVI